MICIPFDIGSGVGDARLPDWFKLWGMEPGFQGDGSNLQDVRGPGSCALRPPLGHADGGTHVQILASLAGENSSWCIAIPFSKIPSFSCTGRNASRNRHCRLLHSYGRSSPEVSQAEGKESSWWLSLTFFLEQICFAHGGGAFPYTVGRIQHGYKVIQNNIEKHLKKDGISGAAWPLCNRLRYSPERLSWQNLDRLTCPRRCSSAAASRGLHSVQWQYLIKTQGYWRGPGDSWNGLSISPGGGADRWHLAWQGGSYITNKQQKRKDFVNIR